MPRPGEKTNFAMACSLLSQYVREKRGVPELGLGMAGKGKSEGIRQPPTTMSLLPGVDVGAGDEGKTADGVGGDVSSRGNAMELFPQRAGFGPAEQTQSSPEIREQEKAQMTIFYDGKVLVFDHIPAEKAKDLLQFACKSTTNAQSFGYAPHATPAPTEIASNPAKTENKDQKPAGEPVSNIPIAPRASLQRFLEKRKHRISAAAPYQVSGGTSAAAGSVKPEEGKSWLGLASQTSNPQT